MHQNMNNSRTHNAKVNMVSSILNKMVTLLLPFLLRTAMIQVLGAEYLGVSSLFTSILQVLSITELGFSSAIVYSMYKPIAQNDTDTICALMNLYKKVYRVIGVVVLLLGLGILPFLNSLITGSYPSDINVQIVYVIYLLNAVVSYFFFAYKTVLLQAHQKINITNNVHTIVSIFINVTQIALLVLLKNYYVYVLLILSSTILNNVIPAYLATKKYPQYACKGKLSDDSLHKIKKQVAGLMIQKICSVTRNSFDSIYISMFLGLTVTAIYGNYYMIITAIIGVMGIITTSIKAGIGNSVASETVEKNHQDFRKFNFAYMLLASWSSVCLFCLYQPFMTLWMGEEMLLDFMPMLLLVWYYYGLCIGNVRSLYTNAVGLFWEFKYRAIIESVLNIFLNYFLGKHFGLIGIIIATLISLVFVNYIYGSRIIFKNYFGMQNIKFYRQDNIVYLLVTMLVMCVTYRLCDFVAVESYFGFFLKIIICGIVPAVLFFMLYCKNKIAKKTFFWTIQLLKK